MQYTQLEKKKFKIVHYAFSVVSFYAEKSISQ